MSSVLTMPYKDPEAARRWREDHREQIAERMRDWRADNAERLRAVDAVRDRTEYRAQYYAANRDEAIAAAAEWNAAHPEQMRAAVAAWKRAHPERHREHQHRRRAKMRGAEWEPIDVLVVAARDEWICYLCDELITLDDLSLDHVVPISKGGAHTYSNVQSSHLLCNLRRGVMPVEQYRERL